jgi:ABC-type antimicrobial peptide transport system permease subunit
VVRRWRSLLGMIIGVGLALGFDLTIIGLTGESIAQLVGDFNKSGANLYIAANGGDLIPLDVNSSNPGTVNQASAVLTRVRSIPGVQAAVGQLSWSLQEEQEGPRSLRTPTKFVPAVGIDGDPNDISNYVLMREGRWLRRANEIVLGFNLSRSKSLGIGDTIRLNGQDFEVVGIGRLRGFGGTGDAVAYVDIRTMRQRTDVGNVVNHIAVQTTNPDAVRSVVQDLPSLRAVSPEQVLNDLYSSSLYQSAISVYWLIDIFILAIAGMFIWTMLTRSVAERRMEFGTMRAIGIPSRTILLSVAAEGVFISLCAYVVGFFVSLLLGGATNAFLAPAFRYERLFGVDVQRYLIILGLSAVLGLVSGFFPARSATKVDPLEVLRQG